MALPHAQGEEERRLAQREQVAPQSRPSRRRRREDGVERPGWEPGGPAGPRAGGLGGRPPSLCLVGRRARAIPGSPGAGQA